MMATQNLMDEIFEKKVESQLQVVVLLAFL